jgi:hypothetical protein
MSEKTKEGRKISPVLEVVLMVLITIILAAVISAFVFGMSANVSRIPFSMTVNDSETDHIDVYVSNISTQQPLQNVLIGIYKYDTDTLLAGPLYTNESGLVYFEIPSGFNNHFRVQGNYNGILYPKIIDRRPFFVKMDEILGNFSIPLYGFILAIFGGLIAYVKKDYLKSKLGKIPKIGKGKDEL